MPRSSNAVIRQSANTGQMPGQRMAQTLQKKREGYLELAPSTISGKTAAQLLNYLTLIFKTRDLAECSMDSLRTGAIDVMRLGLDPNPKIGHVALIPRYSKKSNRMELHVQVQYQGVIEIARRNRYHDVRAMTLFENDDWEINHKGARPQDVEFRLTRWMSRRDEHFDGPGEPRMVLVLWTESDGYGRLNEYSYKELLDYRKYSEPFRRGYGPWIDEEQAMVEKTAVLRWARWIKQTPDVAYLRHVQEAREIGDASAVLELDAEEPQRLTGPAAQKKDRPPTQDDTTRDQTSILPPEPDSSEQEAPDSTEEPEQPEQPEQPVETPTEKMNVASKRVLNLITEDPGCTVADLVEKTKEEGRPFKRETIERYVTMLEYRGHIVQLEDKLVPTPDE